MSLKKSFICYIDMDGVMNLFEDDPKARLNMWHAGYYLSIPVRTGISDVMARINSESHVVIITKIINRIGVTKEKQLWLDQNISPEAYDDVIYVPYDCSKSNYVSTYFPSMLIDDKEANLDECSKKGCHGLFLSDLRISQRYPNARTADDIWTAYQEIASKL